MFYLRKATILFLLFLLPITQCSCFILFSFTLFLWCRTNTALRLCTDLFRRFWSLSFTIFSQTFRALFSSWERCFKRGCGVLLRGVERLEGRLYRRRSGGVKIGRVGRGITIVKIKRKILRILGRKISCGIVAGLVAKHWEDIVHVRGGRCREWSGWVARHRCERECRCDICEGECDICEGECDICEACVGCGWRCKCHIAILGIWCWYVNTFSQPIKTQVYIYRETRGNTISLM